MENACQARLQNWRIFVDFQIRIPRFSSSDGTGNYLRIIRESTFESTGTLPMVLDGIDPNNQVNTGQDNIVRLGYDPATGGNSDILLDFDLYNIPGQMLLHRHR